MQGNQWQTPMYGNPYAMRQPPQGYYQPQQPQPVAQSASMVMVTSRQEAEAAQIVFDGLPHFFANLAEGEIYSKTFDTATNRSVFAVYKLADGSRGGQYATVEALAALEERLNELTDRLDRGRRARREDDV